MQHICQRRLATGGTSASTGTCSATQIASCIPCLSTLRTGAKTRTGSIPLLSLSLLFVLKHNVLQHTLLCPNTLWHMEDVAEKIGHCQPTDVLCRHGDFFTAILKTQPAMTNDWQSRQWSKFFCLSVYVTMYLNDHQRDAFYSSLGMNTTQFNQHVIIETNNTTARIFPEVRAVQLSVTRLLALQQRFSFAI